MVTTAEYDPEQEFHLSFSFSKAFGLSKPTSLAQVNGAVPGFTALQQEIWRSSAQQTATHRNLQISPASAAPAVHYNLKSNRYLLNKPTKLN